MPRSCYAAISLWTGQLIESREHRAQRLDKRGEPYRIDDSTFVRYLAEYPHYETVALEQQNSVARYRALVTAARLRILSRRHSSVLRCRARYGSGSAQAANHPIQDVYAFAPPHQLH